MVVTRFSVARGGQFYTAEIYSDDTKSNPRCMYSFTAILLHHTVSLLRIVSLN